MAFSSSAKGGTNGKQSLQASITAANRKNQDRTIEGTLKQVLADQEAKASEVDTQPEEDLLGDVDAPLIRLVNSLLSEAVRLGASDIHIEPLETMLRIRFRVDGVLQEIQRVPLKLAPPIISRLKIMAELDICERRMPQDGCIRFRQGDTDADLRMSTLPSVFGEKIVMRVLGKSNINNDLSKLGLPADQLSTLRDSINKPDGLVLVTGPTGSGKTTTLYAALNELNEISVSVFTAEDPVEGTLPGITQCQVNPTIGYSFASVLRSLLRQDPDVILVGEIRDQETAEICIKAALTGHLVLSTLHTNCAISTISRLVDIGIAPYLISSSINCIVAQRLVRRICEECKTDRPLPPEMLQSLGAAANRLEGGKFAHGRGCTKCNNTGFRGRAPIYELVTFSDELRRLVLLGASKAELRALTRSQGMLTLREAGLELVKLGVTTLEEVLGITNEDSDVTVPPVTLQTTPSQSPARRMQEIAVAASAVHIATAQVRPDPNPEPLGTSPATNENHTPATQVEIDERTRQAAAKWKTLKTPRGAETPS